MDASRQSAGCALSGGGASALPPASEDPPGPAQGALRYWARVEYDGTDFYGFQVQVHERTVQGELERALQKVTGQAARVTGAGRTDRGVHASGQVVSFEVAWWRDLGELHRALNAVLASDVAIRNMGRAPEGFHPRFSASSRTYRYTLLNQKGRSPLAQRTTWWVERELDMASMARASRSLVGTHDFATFGRPPKGENTVRTVFRAEWRQQGAFLTFEIEANAFLYRMVRSLVGMLVLVGWKEISPDRFDEIKKALDRSWVKLVAPAQGLCLVQVDYPEGVL